MVLVIGTQGHTTSIAASLPLALNRYLLTKDNSRAYRLFYGNGFRIAAWIVVYDVLIFSLFYAIYELNIFISAFNYVAYNILLISIIFTTNLTSAILMLFVLSYIYESLKVAERMDQLQVLKERKRVAWVIISQCIVNFCLTLLKLSGFYNVSLAVGGLPALMCYNMIFNVYNSFSSTFQELFVCIDCIFNVFFLTPYREELFRFVKIAVNRYHTRVGTISTGTAHESRAMT